MRISKTNTYLCVVSFLLLGKGQGGGYCPALPEKTILRPFPFCLSFHCAFYSQWDSSPCRVAKYGYRFSEISFSIRSHIYFYFRGFPRIYWLFIPLGDRAATGSRNIFYQQRHISRVF